MRNDTSKKNANGGDRFDRHTTDRSGGRSVRICGDEFVELAGSGSVRRKGHHLLAGSGSAGAEPDIVRWIFEARRAPQVAHRQRLGAVDAGGEGEIPRWDDAKAVR